MAGLDTDFDGEARPQPGINVGFLSQEPQLKAEKDVRGNVEEGVADAMLLESCLTDLILPIDAAPTHLLHPVPPQALLGA